MIFWKVEPKLGESEEKRNDHWAGEKRGDGQKERRGVQIY
jgi:hypothetical protein